MVDPKGALQEGSGDCFGSEDCGVPIPPGWFEDAAGTTEPIVPPTTEVTEPPGITLDSQITLDQFTIEPNLANGPSQVARGNLGVTASIARLGENYVGKEVPVRSSVYGSGRIDLFSTGERSCIEVKIVQRLYLTEENEFQLLKYVDAVGGHDLHYDIYTNYLDPDFESARKLQGVTYTVSPYIPYIS